MSLKEILIETSAQSTYFPAVLSLFFFKKLKNEIRILIFLVCLRVCLEIVTFTLTKNEINNLFLPHFYVFLEFVFIALMFSEATKTYISQKIYYYTIAVFFIFSVVNIIYFEPLDSSNKLGRALESVFVPGFCFVYFAQLLAQLKVERLDKDPFFWISCVLLLYFTGSIFKFLVIHLFQEPTNFIELFDKLLYFLNLLCNLVFCLAIWLASKQKQ